MQKKSLQVKKDDVVEEDIEFYILKTDIKKEVYERLKEFAMQYSTGFGKWHFGVAIQILLDYYEDSKRAIDSEKLDMIIGLLQNQLIEKDKKVETKQEGTELLGGEIIPKE